MDILSDGEHEGETVTGADSGDGKYDSAAEDDDDEDDDDESPEDAWKDAEDAWPR